MNEITAYLAKPSPPVAAWNVLGPESGKVDVELDEDAAQSAGDAPYNHVDWQLPYVIPETRAIQRNVVVVQSQVTPDAKSSVKYLAWLLVKLCQEVQGTHSCASCQETSPEQGCAVEGRALFDG